ncbi:uncharacterized protein BO97DRAFT_409370 [Aspergillus homomorphus CBS 101889]|uniref:Uncharacterized protein n=1 Tax=Aspergillus homomorphus (strain CBS 101889) TaxID=1450537 RepID=A0A395HGB1_ASPHC|nr:hypothetical protein BO97DRAFT_409370 [Aspergillus homomorphus CBS 101889]RAL06887.1 hypothetical protein BO97DRAFT_409370 [Aspergillus homomorphus CBS 101889]
MPATLSGPRARVLLLRSPPTSLTSLNLLRHHHHHHQQKQLNKHHFSTTSTALKTHTRRPSPQSANSPPPSLSSTATTTTFPTDINPPPSTRPADLSLPSALAPSASPADKLKRYIAIGRAYASFYKTGLKNVYHNYRAALPLRRALGLPAYLPTSPSAAVIRPRMVTGNSSANNKTAAATTTMKSATAISDSSNKAAEAVISRSTFHLLHRSAYDIRRMIPFTLILIVCGEMTPLAVLALGNAVTPRTCRVPKQLEKERGKRVQRKKMALLAPGSVTPPEVGSDAEMSAMLELVRRSAVDGDKDAVGRACALFGLAKSHQHPAWAVQLVYRARLQRYLDYLELDDEMIRRGGGVQAMEAAEVRCAVEERGGVGVGSPDLGKDGWQVEREERRWLEKWLQRREKRN